MNLSVVTHISARSRASLPRRDQRGVRRPQGPASVRLSRGPGIVTTRFSRGETVSPNDKYRLVLASRRASALRFVPVAHFLPVRAGRSRRSRQIRPTGEAPLSSDIPSKTCKQAPTASLVALGREHAFAFEIHVIDQRIAAVRAVGEAVETAPRLFRRSSGRSGREHFWQRIAQPFHHEIGLQIDRVGEKNSQIFHPLARLGGEKFRARIPRASAVFPPEQ